MMLYSARACSPVVLRTRERVCVYSRHGGNVAGKFFYNYIALTTIFNFFFFFNYLSSSLDKSSAAVRLKSLDVYLKAKGNKENIYVAKFLIQSFGPVASVLAKCLLLTKVWER